MTQAGDAGRLTEEEPYASRPSLRSPACCGSRHRKRTALRLGLHDCPDFAFETRMLLIGGEDVAALWLVRFPACGWTPRADGDR